MFARTERLMLRPGWIEDAPALSRAIADEAVVRNLAQAPWPYARGDAEAFLRRSAEAALPECLIFTRTLAAPRLVGGIGLRRDPGGEVELGYWIARPCWGLGFATEAGRAMIALARDSLRIRRVVGSAFLDNPASAHVLRKLGFVATGRVATRLARARGRAVPCAMFERVLEDQMEGNQPRLAA